MSSIAFAVEGKNKNGMDLTTRVSMRVMGLIFFIANLWLVVKLIPHPAIFAINSTILIYCYALAAKIARR